ncbi:hypothetical protein HNY73_018011 [Argiope bruennichi]|uniref:Uncharacterized protein n=1 Tax=Argiope bruennichi TaxID=94029 RepID=A0A8T0ECX1_ARGBR|nr:hypothetical protein HNY73_018011 [Argiope bruennichi]
MRDKGNRNIKKVGKKCIVLWCSVCEVCRNLGFEVLILVQRPLQGLISGALNNRASVFKSAKAEKPSETFDFGDDIQKPNEADFDLETAKQYLIMLYYSMERGRLDRENEIRIAFGELPIPRSKYAI